MSGLLSALNLGRTGMAASQKAMEVIGNNVANVNTDGYSRQTIQTEALPTIESGGLSFGQGVQVSGIDRAQDSFITDRLRAAGEQLGEAEAKASPLTDLERIVSMDENSLAGKIDSFFGAWDKLALNPGGEVERSMVLQEADSLASSFSSVQKNLQGVRKSIDGKLSTSLEGINSKLKQVAELNSRIQQGTTGGKSPNTALDQRDTLLHDLAREIGATAVAGDNGAVSVQLPSGLTLVQDSQAFTLQSTKSGEAQFSLHTAGSSVQLSRSDVGGAFGGLLDVRDETLAGAMDDIGKLRQHLIVAVNARHSQGMGLDGDTGRNFFQPVTQWSSKTSFPSKASAALSGGDLTVQFDGGSDATISIADNASLEEARDAINSAQVGVVASIAGTESGEFVLQIASSDPSVSVSDVSGSGLGLGGFAEQAGSGDSGLSVAVDDIEEVAAGLTDAEGDNRNAQAIANLKDAAAVEGRYTFVDYYGKIASTMGVAVEGNDFTRNSLQDTMDQLTNRRDEIAGVSIDESMISLQRYQQGFQASAKYLSTVDEMMQTLLSLKR